MKRKLTEGTTNQEHENPADKTARITATATIWMARFTAILVGVSAGTFWILKNQLAEMHSGGVDTHDLARSAELDQRAWLGASDYTFKIADSGPINSHAIVLNTGKTPAMESFCRTTGITKQKGYVLTDSDIVYPDELPVIRQGTIFPNQHFPLSAVSHPMELEKQKIWFGNVKSGEWVQYFFGEIRYRDIFRHDHWTHFCTQYVPDTNDGSPCPVYNDTDDDNKK